MLNFQARAKSDKIIKTIYCLTLVVPKLQDMAYQIPSLLLNPSFSDSGMGHIRKGMCDRKVAAGEGLCVSSSAPSIELNPIPVPKLQSSLPKEVENLRSEIKKLKSRKKYGLVWDDKSEQVVELCKEKLPVLEAKTDKIIGTNKNEPINILIEGDNYHALSVLNYTHKEKVDIIYIDPPYNTGNKDFIFNDKFVDKEDSYRHSKWISFMAKRLSLSKILLKDSGAIFISIDDNEMAQLKLLCDEIFGEKNFVDCITWEKKSSAKGVPPKNMVVNVHEYILIYQKSSKFSFIGEPRSKEGFSNPDNDPRGLWRNTNIKSTVKDKSKAFTITDPATGHTFTDVWAFSKDNLEQLIKEKYIIFPKNKDGQVRIKEFYSEFKNSNIPIKSSWGLFDNQKNTEMLKAFLGDVMFLNPKPLDLLIYLIKSSTKKDAVILDFFAGSGTTAHALMVVNKQDSGYRKFILCTDNENGIAEKVCHKRLKIVVEGHQNYKDITSIQTNIRYFKTDFVDADPTDQNKKKLVDKSTEMLCLKEDCFEDVKNTKNFKIFSNTDGKYLGIIYDDAGIEPFKKELKRLAKKAVVFVFSLDDSAREEEFEDVEHLVELKPIPAVILNVYKRIFR